MRLSGNSILSNGIDSKRVFITLSMFLAVLFVIFFGVEYKGRLTESWRLNSDPKVYMTMGWNLYAHHIFADDSVGSKTLHPSAYRLPGYPFFLSNCIRLSPRFRIRRNGQTVSVSHFLVGFVQSFLTVVVAFLSLGIVFRLTGSRMAGCLVFFLVGLDNAMAVMSFSILPEILVASMLILFAFLFLEAFKRQTILSFGLCGFILGLLSLTRGQFQYFIPLGVALFFFTIYKKQKRSFKNFIGICIFALIPFLMISGWKIRNYHHFSRFYLTDRGGLVLDARAEYNLMSSREYLAAFVYYLAKNGGPDFRGNINFLENRDYKRLNPGMKNPYSLEVKARKRRNELVEKYGNYTAADKIQLMEAIRKIESHPFRHLLSCLPFGFRGMFAKKGLMGLSLFGVFLGFFIWAVIKRKADCITVFLPPVFSFGFYSFVSLNEPRFNMPLIPFLYISLVLSFWFFSKQIPGNRFLKHLDRYGWIDRINGNSP